MARRGKRRRRRSPARPVPGPRAAALLLLVLALVTVPAVAIARFADARSAQLSVGTASMPVPAQVMGTATCSSGLANRSLTLTVTGFATSGPAAELYRYEILRGGNVTASVQSPQKTAQLTAQSGLQILGSVTWTVRITAVRDNWTSPPWTDQFTCNPGGSGGGPLS